MDPLLRELAKHEAGVLVLNPGCRPTLRVGEQEREIARSELQTDQIAVLVGETGPVGSNGRFLYELDGLGFIFNVSRDNGTCRARVVRAAASKPPQSQSSPVAQPAIAEEDPAPAAGSQAVTPSGPRAPGLAGPLPDVSILLESLIERSGSDLHLSSRQKPRMRVHGELLELAELQAPKSEELKQRLWKVTPERNRNEFQENHHTDFAIEISGQARFRVNLFRDRAGIGAVFRQGLEGRAARGLSISFRAIVRNRSA